MIASTAWMSGALCAEVGTEPFFPELGESTVFAKQVCGMCPVAAACLEYALVTNQTEGIWAGTSPKTRAAMRRAAA